MRVDDAGEKEATVTRPAGRPPKPREAAAATQLRRPRSRTHAAAAGVPAAYRPFLDGLAELLAEAAVRRIREGRPPRVEEQCKDV